MMKVCLLNNDFNNKTGSGRFCLSLVRALVRLDPDLDCKVITLTKVSLKGWGLISFLRYLRKTARDFDVIHALDGWPHGVVAVLATLGLKKKIVVTLIGTGAVQPLYHPIKRRLLEWGYRQVDKLVAVSRNTRAEILRVIPDLEIEVINHGVDFEKFQTTNPKLQTNPKIQNLKPYILSVGALKKRKGYEYSIRAFAEVAARFPDLKYVIVGRGPERETLELQVASYKLQDRVVFLENLSGEELIEMYHGAELFILLPQDVGKDIEGFGLVFLEAAACGLPVVAALGTSAEDAVLNKKNGILVPAQDYQAAAHAMAELLSSPELINSFSENSFKFAKIMSWEKTAGAYLKIYRGVMERRVVYR